MSEYERLTEAISSIQNQYEIGIDYSDGKDMAAICLIDGQAETVIKALSEFSELSKAKSEGRLIILPSKSEEIIRIVELALRIKLYDWQKAYITGVSDYVMPGRVSGKTTAYMIRLCLSEGNTIDLTKRDEIRRYADGCHGSHYLDWFRHELQCVYMELKKVSGLKLRTIIFNKPKARDVYDRR
ncbi:MAG TPA: hypothetical protein GX523_06740 [Desulfitobacterium dehalogenans]|uniref:Uncharacterized protein n=1 Tax=Desulfitobacterium dehalogenans TaxID=36854 RepID=A0A7C7D566_9FIRM|nr:hypothetical protein [Desulfitobacterium dehalogenans]